MSPLRTACVVAHANTVSEVLKLAETILWGAYPDTLTKQ